MKRLVFLFFMLLVAGTTFAQKVNLKAVTEKLKAGQLPVAQDFGFTEYQIPVDQDTVFFYTYQKPGTQPNAVYITLPGSNAENIYTWHNAGRSEFWFNSLTDFDFSYLPDNYLLVIVAKPGFGFCGKSDEDHIPEKYWKYTSLDDRVFRANLALEYAKKHLVKNPKKVVAFGYSEGFYVGAKLAVVNKSITHLGIGGGGGYIDFYDFILENQKTGLKNQADPDTIISWSRSIIETFQQIMADPDSREMTYGYSNKRWASFAEPPVKNLTTLNIPIFQVHGTEDDMTPVESAYIVPLEFARLKKSNLTFKLYARCDHSLVEKTPDGKEIEHKGEMMNAFFRWVDEH